jgi:dolichol-phosphate mannosyltransferase
MNKVGQAVSPARISSLPPAGRRNRLPHFWRRWLKFNAVGAIGIAVQLAVLMLLKSGLGLNYLLATALAVEATALHNFFWHERFTWSDRRTQTSLERLVKFNLTTGGLSILGNVIAMKLLVEVTGANYVLANLLSIAACSIVNFLVADRAIFVPEAPER